MITWTIFHVNWCYQDRWSITTISTRMSSRSIMNLSTVWWETILLRETLISMRLTNPNTSNLKGKVIKYLPRNKKLRTKKLQAKNTVYSLKWLRIPPIKCHMNLSRKFMKGWIRDMRRCWRKWFKVKRNWSTNTVSTSTFQWKLPRDTSNWWKSQISKEVQSKITSLNWSRTWRRNLRLFTR